MTNLKSLIRVFTRQKIQKINYLLMFDVIAILLTVLYKIYKGTLNAMDPLLCTMSYSLIIFIVAFILIARVNERIFVNDSYRLIPISDTKLYSINLLSTFISMIYLGIIQIIFSIIAAITNFKHSAILINQIFVPYSTQQSEIIGALFGLAILLIMSIIFLGTSISLIHLIIRSLTAFLPDSQSRVYRFILYVIVIGGLLYLLGKIFNPIIDIFYGLANTNYQLYLTSLSLLVMVGLESILNVYLLKNWVETKN